MPPSEPLRAPGQTFLNRGILLLLVLLALASTAIGVRNAMQRSQDFQWSGARLLDQHTDPWAVYLSGDPGHRLIGQQIPNYLPVLYLLLAPLGLLPAPSANLAWAICNVLLALGCGWLTARFYGFRGRGVATVVCLFLAATPTRMTIGNGQQGLLILFLWCLALFAVPKSGPMSGSRAALAGISYAKFSFAPPVFLYLLFRRGPSAALMSLVPIAGGAILVWLWLAGPHSAATLLQVLGEPFQVARTGFRPLATDENLMNLVQSVLPPWPEPTRTALALGFSLGACAVGSYCACWRYRHASLQWQLALMATMSFALFNHHAYDAVVLLLPFAYSLRFWRDAQAQVVLALLGYLFYLQRAVESVHLHRRWMTWAEFAMLAGVFALTLRLQELEPDFAERPFEPERPVFEEDVSVAS